MFTVKSTDLAKGTVCYLAGTGWRATLMDNCKRQNTRVAMVEGFYTEAGSVYTHDIELAEIDGDLCQVQHTPKQNEMREQVAAWGL
jgi:hypothetical protein